jgi:hypothetical protein
MKNIVKKFFYIILGIFFVIQFNLKIALASLFKVDITGDVSHRSLSSQIVQISSVIYIIWFIAEITIIPVFIVY